MDAGCPHDSSALLAGGSLAGQGVVGRRETPGLPPNTSASCFTASTARETQRPPAPVHTRPCGLSLPPPGVPRGPLSSSLQSQAQPPVVLPAMRDEATGWPEPTSWDLHHSPSGQGEAGTGRFPQDPPGVTKGQLKAEFCFPNGNTEERRRPALILEKPWHIWGAWGRRVNLSPPPPDTGPPKPAMTAAICGAEGQARDRGSHHQGLDYSPVPCLASPGRGGQAQP